jgi:hypothetical protein
MKKIMIMIPITVAITVIFEAAMLAASIGTFESVYAQTNATNTTNANNTTTAERTSAGDLENLTRGNTGLSQNRGDIANPTIGLTGGLEKEQINDTEGNMTAADKTSGQNATNTSDSGGANTTTTANNTSVNQTSSENKTGNPLLSDVPIVGELFK